MKKDKPASNEVIKANPAVPVILPEEEKTKGPGEYSSGTLHDELTGEKDADSMVHEQQNTFLTDNVEQDLDEAVHNQGSTTTAKQKEEDLTEEEDMDELVHRNADKRS